MIKTAELFHPRLEATLWKRCRGTRIPIQSGALFHLPPSEALLASPYRKHFTPGSKLLRLGSTATFPTWEQRRWIYWSPFRSASMGGAARALPHQGSATQEPSDPRKGSQRKRRHRKRRKRSVQGTYPYPISQLTLLEKL